VAVWRSKPTDSLKPLFRTEAEQTVEEHSCTTGTLVRSQNSPCGICGGQSGIGIGFSHSIYVSSCQYHSSNQGCTQGWEAASLQPPQSPNPQTRYLKNTDSVDIISDVLRHFPFSRNEPLQSAHHKYIRIFENKVKKLVCFELD
jgi:hypothetical protein